MKTPVLHTSSCHRNQRRTNTTKVCPCQQWHTRPRWLGMPVWVGMHACSSHTAVTTCTCNKPGIMQACLGLGDPAGQCCVPGCLTDICGPNLCGPGYQLQPGQVNQSTGFLICPHPRSKLTTMYGSMYTYMNVILWQAHTELLTVTYINSHVIVWSIWCNRSTISLLDSPLNLSKLCYWAIQYKCICHVLVDW